jgi:hypothetical protein
MGSLLLQLQGPWWQAHSMAAEWHEWQDTTGAPVAWRGRLGLSAAQQQALLAACHTAGPHQEPLLQGIIAI